MQKYKSIDLAGLEIAYREKGRGRPVVFVHGFASSSHTWLDLIPLLPAARKYIALDLKGFGRSAKPEDKNYSAYDQAKLLTGFLNQLDLKAPVLVGHSWGGIVTLLALLENNLKNPVSGMVLINSVAYFKHVPDFIKTLRPPLGTLLALLPTPQVLVRQVLQEVFYDRKKITEELISAYAENLSSPEAKKSLVATAAQFVSDDLKEVHKKFKKIHIPTLVINGADDRVIPVEESYALKRDLPQVELKTIPMCGHSPQEECPQETAALLAKFLAQV